MLKAVFTFNTLGLLLCAALGSSGVLATSCGSVTITSVADAVSLRQNCSTVTGDVTIGPFNQSSTQHINLDGIEVIQGNLQSYKNDFNNQTFHSAPFTVSSTTLQRVNTTVDFSRGQNPLWNLTLPNLRSAGSFLLREAPITYLDITSLESVAYISIEAENITTLRHTRLTDAGYLSISSMQVDSIDSFFNNAINITEGYITGPFPNIKTVTVGFTYAWHLAIDQASLDVILGGASTTDMDLRMLDLFSNVTGLKRDSNLQSLTAEYLTFSDTNIARLDLDFDNIGTLYLESMRTNASLGEIRLPPKAVNWTSRAAGVPGFGFSISECPGLNLSSQYGTDDAGNRIQTWYWPTNISRLQFERPTVRTDFFETFISQEMKPLNSTPPPSKLKAFIVEPYYKSNFNCSQFDILNKTGRISDYLCVTTVNTPSESGSGFIRAPALSSIACLAALTLLFVLFN